MAISSSFANDARKQVGRFLVEQVGYSKKSEKDFYKQGDDILTHVSFQKSRGITQLHVGIVPLYIPNSLHIMYTVNLTRELLPGCILLEDDNAHKAALWAEKIIEYLNGGILAFIESISSSQPLLDYLKNCSTTDRRFVMPPIERDQLIFFSSAYGGDVTSAIEYAKAAQRKIKEERIDNLANNVAKWNEEIAKLHGCLAKSSNGNKIYYEERISACEREKELAIFDAKHNAPSTMQMYEKWIEPFVASGFSREGYFSQIIEHNKAHLKYEKLFSSRVHKKS